MCINAVVLAAAAMAFQPGRYAVEAGGVEPDAASNLPGAGGPCEGGQGEEPVAGG